MFGLKARKQKFPRILSTADWITADAVSQPAQWNKIGQYIVPAQQEITFGANDPVGGASVAGRSVFIDLRDSSNAALHGKVRFVLMDANQTRTQVVLEENTRKLNADANDRTKAVVLPEFSLRAGEDSILQIQFYPESATAVTIDYDATNTLYLVPVTVYQ